MLPVPNAAPASDESRPGSSETYMPPSQDVQTFSTVAVEGNIRIGVLLTLTALVVLTVQDVLVEPAVLSAVLLCLAFAGRVTYRYTRARRT